jgi:hypothetical protein
MLSRSLLWRIVKPSWLACLLLSRQRIKTSWRRCGETRLPWRNSCCRKITVGLDGIRSRLTIKTEIETLKSEYPTIDAGVLKLGKTRAKKLTQKREAISRLEELLSKSQPQITKGHFEILLALNELKSAAKKCKTKSKTALTQQVSERIILVTRAAVQTIKSLQSALQICCRPITHSTDIPVHLAEMPKLVFDCLAWMLPDLEELLSHQTKISKAASTSTQVDAALLEISSQVSGVALC